MDVHIDWPWHTDQHKQTRSDMVGGSNLFSIDFLVDDDLLGAFAYLPNATNRKRFISLPNSMQ